MKFFLKGLLLSLAASSSAVHASKVVSVSDARLPMSLSTVVSELEADGMKDGLTTACLITSRGVTRSEKESLLQEAFDLEGDSITTSKVVGVEGGIVVTQPKTLAETIVAAGICDGTILYYPSSGDLERGEGLFDTLAPTIERILVAMEEGKPACLMVVSKDMEAAGAKAKFEEAANRMLQNLAVSSKKLSQLSDAFSQVVYVTPSQVSGELSIPREAAEIKAAVSSSSSLSLSLDSSSSTMAPRDLAAARLLGPKKRAIMENALQVVKSAVEAAAAAQDDATEALVSNFGPLIDSTIARAKQELKTEASSEGGIVSSSVFQQLSQNLEQELQSELLDVYQKQLSILQLTAYEGFKKRLSQLRITPGLPYEMDQIVQKSVAEFSALAKKLESKSMTDSGSSVASAKTAFGRKCKEYTSDRLLAAEASGQFKPIPRKGFSVGFHWLLPKPFGNDYRQEPWMVHATDNMVYIPKSKVTEVGPTEVATGDWRDKIVPSPAGNDMIFMQ